MSLKPRQTQEQQFAQETNLSRSLPVHSPLPPLAEVESPHAVLQQAPFSLRTVIWEVLKQSLKSLLADQPSFAEEQGNVSWRVIGLQFFCMVLIVTGINIISFLLHSTPILPRASSNSSTAPAFLALMFGGSTSAVFTGLGVVVVLLFSIGIQHLLAKMLGGVGTFKQQIYSYLLFCVPMGLVSGLLSLFPLPGWVNIVLGIYIMGLDSSSIQAVHRLSTSKTTWVVLLPGIIASVVLFIFTIIFFSPR